jgi:hypothetical protein
MPITPYLNGVRFDLETRRILGLALEMVCIAVRTGDCDEGVKQAIATKIIELAKAGERNPDLLCERVLEKIRGSKGRPLGEAEQRHARRATRFVLTYAPAASDGDPAAN